MKSSEETHEDFKKLKAGKKVKESYYINVVEELATFDDWCISSNIDWGVPIPFFYDQNDKILMDDEIVSHFKEVVDEHGPGAWYEKTVAELLPPSYKN